MTNILSDEINSLYPKNAIKILVGCAPCQPFSKYTNRYRKEGQLDDKWKLLYTFSRFIREIQPEIVSMENVPELEKESVFIDFKKVLVDLNYQVQEQIVYCPDYGVPQKRKRLVLLASKLGKIQMIQPLYRPEEYRTVRMAIGNLPPINDGEVCRIDSMHRASKLSAINKRRIVQSVPGGTWRDWDEKLQLKCHGKTSGKTYASVYGRMCWDEPSPTITTQFYGYGNGRFGHPTQNRAISLREGAILQSFPENYDFSLELGEYNMKKIGTHIGNAVPVKLAEAIGHSIINHLVDMEK